MSVLKLIFLYSLRIVRREWRRFVLPLVSLTVTSIVLVVILLITASSTQLLEEQARELQGGDVVFESNSPFDGATLFSSADISPSDVSEKISFSGTLQSELQTSAFTVEVVDANYPLYGELLLRNDIFNQIENDIVYIDEIGLERLGVSVGDSVSFGDASFIVAGEVLTKPTSLFGGFSFLPTVFMSIESFAKAGIDPALLRAEYSYSAKVSALSSEMIASLRTIEETSPLLNVNIAGQDQRGLQFGLATVSDFLIIAVLITAVLAAVNVYASTLYLVSVERKSLAVFLALGMIKTRLVWVLGAALMYVVLLASVLGTLLGIGLFQLLQSGIASQYLISLPTPNILMNSLVSSILIFLISVMSFIPAIRKSLELNPKQILIGGDDTPRGRRSFLSLVVITSSTLVPLVLLASFLLQSILQGVLVIGGIAVIYIFVAIAYTFFIRILYKQRVRMPFFLRSIVSQKYADGLFGVVSFASLFVALAALCTLALTQASLERFLTNDLTQTIPSTYILDVQPSQKDELAENFPQIELFSNVRARIIAIDELRIQDELAVGNNDISRELGREFNLTARNELLQSESIVGGEWSAGRAGEISVDEEFAQQANIEIGSIIVFSIQGFEVSGTVTSFRSTDSRSGLPFFYFVLSPEDIDMFPSVYFGYAYIEADIQATLGRFVATTMSNVSVLETQALGTLLLQLVGTLLILVLIVTLPPLLIATLLIAMLVVSSYATRRRDGARLRALGMTRKRSFWLYMLETLSVASLASIFAYGIGVLVTLLVNTYFLKLDMSPIYDTGLIVGLGLIIFFIFSIALYLYKTDTLELKEILSHE